MALFFWVMAIKIERVDQTSSGQIEIVIIFYTI